MRHDRGHGGQNYKKEQREVAKLNAQKPGEKKVNQQRARSIRPCGGGELMRSRGRGWMECWQEEGREENVSSQQNSERERSFEYDKLNK